ncbi:hypothetical protein [Pseudorhodoferax sp.]|uniref:hypothetical protein n=1 Tax=Pseudorhodoferax sp. TaxID=1993553 RepID=UPI0039E3BF32
MRTHRPGWLLGLLLCAWLAAQTLGLAHRELHAPAPGAAAQVAGAHGDAFHAAGSDCRLYDQAGLADLLACAALPDLPAAAIPVPAALPRPALRARPAPPFHARGPPAPR